MPRWPWRAVLIGVVATVLIYAATRPDPETRGVIHAGPAELIEQLGSSRDVVRRAAAARLIGEGVAAIPHLVAAAKEAPEEQLRQIFLVLEDMYISADQALADAAEDAVELLTQSDRTEVRRGAEDLFASNTSRRQLRAYNKIEMLSGKLLATPLMPPQFAGRRSTDTTFPDLVVIGPDWTGGDEGLRYIRRMRGVMAVHISNDAPVSEAAIRALKEFTTVRRESDGCLGVELTERGGGLSIRWVVPGSPADRAGMRPFDRLASLDHEELDGYYEFLSILRRRQAGDVLAVDVLRDNALISLEVVLGSDFGTGRCRCLDEPADAAAQSHSFAPGPSSPVSDSLTSPIPNGPAHPLKFHAGTVPGLDRAP
jgi:hypothetical protein